MSLDIETGQDQTVYSIAFHLTETLDQNFEQKTVFMRGNQENCLLEDGGECIFVKDEHQLMKEILSYFQKWDPDILIGWYGRL